MSNIKTDDTTSDGLLVGTRPILTSPNVEPAPPSVNRPIPVPSVYVDERGEIFNIQVGKSRINLLSTKQGVMRSGDLHENTQHDFVFSGNVEVWTLCPDGTTEKTIYKSFDYIRIAPFTPHIFHFLADTILAEWWEPQGFYAWFYNPYRKLVQESFQSKCPGQFRRLKAEDDSTNRTGSVGNAAMIFSGLTVGLAVGYLMGSSRRR